MEWPVALSNGIKKKKKKNSIAETHITYERNTHLSRGGGGAGFGLAAKGQSLPSVPLIARLSGRIGKGSRVMLAQLGLNTDPGCFFFSVAGGWDGWGQIREIFACTYSISTKASWIKLLHSIILSEINTE